MADQNEEPRAGASGGGAVTPPRPQSGPISGPVVVRVESVAGCNDGIPGAESDHQVCRCAYPDGFVKNHPATGPDDLVAKVTRQLRNRHGVRGNIEVKSTPGGLSPGDIVLEVEGG